MAHGLMENDTMFSVKERPWHGLGTVLNEAPSIQEAIMHAGLNWNVETEQLFTADGETVDRKAVRRMDTREILGNVGPDWKPLQNLNSFEFFQEFLDQNLAYLETAGSLFNGKKVFIMAKIKGDDIPIVKKSDDCIEQFVLLSNSHDGGSVRVGFTPIRVVCNNTLTMAHNSDASRLIRVKHSSMVESNINNLKNTMNLITKQFEATADQYRLLAKTEINQDDVRNYFVSVFDLKSEDEAKKKQHALETLVNLYENGIGSNLVGSKGTAWGLYNAATQFLSHETGRNEQNRYGSLWFGINEMKNRKALQTALQLAA